MDIWDKKKRSEVMSKIRSKNTKPEMILRKALFAIGYRYRINYKKLPGKPDIVLPKYKTAIFIHGCFWHGHDNCKIAHIPKTNKEFWENKISTNKKRDIDNILKINFMGWKSIVVWECELKKSNMDNVVNSIIMIIHKPISYERKIELYEQVDDKIIKVAEEIVNYIQKN